MKLCLYCRYSFWKFNLSGLSSLLVILPLLLVSSCNSETAKLKRISHFNSFLIQLGAVTRAPKAAHIPPFTANHSLGDICNSFSMDANKNLYCGGQTNGSIGEINASGGSAVGDFLVVKFSPNGKILWATQLGQNTKDDQGTTDLTDDGDNSFDDRCLSLAVDDEGSVYCAGDTRGKMDTRGVRTTGDRDAVVIKLNKDGRLQWVTQFGTTGDEACRNIKISPDRSVYCAGGTNGALVHTNASTDAFLAKIPPNGNLSQGWIRQLGSSTTTETGISLDVSMDESCAALEIDKSNDVICVGDTTSSLLLANSEADIFIWKLSEDGATKEINQYASPGADWPLSSALNADGELIIGGTTDGSFGEQLGGGGDIFVMKIELSGNLKKVQLGNITKGPGMDNSQFDFCDTVDLDGKGNIYCSGGTSGSIGEPNYNTFKDALIVKFSPDLEFLDAIQLGRDTYSSRGNNSGDEMIQGIAVDYWGNIYGGGYTTGSMSESNGGGSDIFIFKLDTNQKFD